MKDIVIIANFVAGLHGTDNNRFTYLANELCKENDVELVASTFCHGEKKQRSDIFEYPFKLTLLDEPCYKKNVCLKRFWSHYIWGRNVLKYIKNRKKPDVIYCAVPSLTAASKVSKYCKKNGIRFIVDIQDLWPEAFQMTFNVPVISDILFFPFKYLANIAYRNADEIVAVSQTYVDRALKVNQKLQSGYVVFLGTNLETFDSNVKSNFVPKSNDSEFRLAYCGTLGSSYDLTTVFDALKIVKNNSKTNIKFYVMGDGPRRIEFEEYAKNHFLNVEFLGRIPYPQMCGILSSCDVAVNPIVSGAAQSIINKHADYAAAGIPVLNTQECAEYRKLVDTYKMGFNCNNGDARHLAQMLEHLVSLPNVRENLGKNARKCAEENFDRKYSYRQILSIL